MRDRIRLLDVECIEAGSAGTGKTRTLREVIKALPQKSTFITGENTIFLGSSLPVLSPHGYRFYAAGQKGYYLAQLRRDRSRVGDSMVACGLILHADAGPSMIW